MAIIHADGLSHGDRLKRCSDMAQLYWPFFYVASNTCARLEINYPKLIATIFANLKEPPSEENFFSYLGEYQDVYLLFVYQVEGRIWGQWDTDEDNLRKYKLKADQKTPEPPKKEFEEWKAAYQRLKKENQAKSFSLRTFVIPSNNSARVKKTPNGIGVGVGLGVGKDRQGEEKATTAQALPDWIPVSQWKAWLELRKKLRKPLIDSGVSLAIKKLDSLRARGHPPDKVLEQSILHSWQGLFELKAEQGNGNGTTGTHRDKIRRANATAETATRAALGLTDVDSELLQARLGSGGAADVDRAAVEVLPPASQKRAHGAHGGPDDE